MAGAVVVALTELTRPLFGALLGLVLVLALVYFATLEGIETVRDFRGKEERDEVQARAEAEERERRRAGGG